MAKQMPLELSEAAPTATSASANSQAQDAARRSEYRRRLAEKLKDPEFRKIEGFPIGTDEAILALSDPPYYTACPNPFLGEWLAEHARPHDPATDTYQREPFAADVSEGKNDPIYNAHSYHTKVPHKAIMRYILHYTQPGDVVYDGFCGTGMTGVAAQLCGDRAQVESLGYHVAADGGVWEPEAWAARLALDKGLRNPHPHLQEPKAFSQLGARKAVLNDLSPAATFIATGYNLPFDNVAFEEAVDRILAEVNNEISWMYETLHTDGVTQGTVDFTVWSEVYSCPNCGAEVAFLEEALDRDTMKIREEFPCPACRSLLQKRMLVRQFIEFADSALRKVSRVPKRKPVWIQYRVGSRKYEKRPDANDLNVIRRIDQLGQPSLPTTLFPFDRMWEAPRLRGHGIEAVHHMFLPRTGHALALIWSKATCQTDPRIRRGLLFLFEQLIAGMSLLARYAPTHFSQVNRQLAGVYYVGGQVVDVAPNYILDGKRRQLSKVMQTSLVSRHPPQPLMTTGSCTSVPLAPNSLDYIFTDPPFGDNFAYWELNFLVEAFHGVFSAGRFDATVDRGKADESWQKNLRDYVDLMAGSLTRNFQALKPGRWMTVEFHNSANSVWNAIREAIEMAGFVIADVRVLDKQQFSFKQVNSTGATKQDLVISCYKPTAAFERQFTAHLGHPAGVRAFLEQHLAMLPVAPVTKAGRLELLAERTTSLLYDRMIAYHLVRGAPIPLSAPQFRALLADLCVDRDGMWFLPGQEAKYDALKMRGVEVEQLAIFVQNERSAIAWLRAELSREPQTLGELTPKFMQALKEWPKNEARPELRDLLHDSFIPGDEGRWTLPDPDNEAHLEKLRQASLLKAFRGYCQQPGKLTSFRTEAMLEGFKHCWQTEQFAVVVSLCARCKPDHLQAHPDLMLLHDLCKDRLPEGALAQNLEFVWG